MLKQGRCNDDGYSLLEVMTVLVLVGLVVGLASGAFSFVVNAYSRGSEQAWLQQEARAVAIFLERELVYSKRLAAYSSPESPPEFQGSFLETYSDGNAVLVDEQPIFSADGMEYELAFHSVSGSNSLLNIKVTINSRKTQRTASVSKTVRLLNAQLEGTSGDRVRYVK
ncbi:prepilin-type N-terminal cleavage/methylation domain-containing protein [Candidatus Darwinibacter acetoxidans]|jgi:prepilin-type N-terminal cleavage/methylation domain-containing protein